MSVAITSTGDRDAHASPTAPSVLAAPGPVVVRATPSRPVARAYPSAAYAAACSWRTPTRRIEDDRSASHNARLWTPGSPKHTSTPARSSSETMTCAPADIDAARHLTAALKIRGDPSIAGAVIRRPAMLPHAYFAVLLAAVAIY